MSDGGTPRGEANPVQAETFPTRTRPRVLIALAVALVVATGVAYWSWARQPERLEGDRGQVTAGVGQDCRYFVIESDGLILRGAAERTDWRGQTVPGRLDITDAWGDPSHVSAKGVFTADDGMKVAVQGGTQGEVIFTADCPLWPGGF